MARTRTFITINSHHNITSRGEGYEVSQRINNNNYRQGSSLVVHSIVNVHDKGKNDAHVYAENKPTRVKGFTDKVLIKFCFKVDLTGPGISATVSRLDV